MREAFLSTDFLSIIPQIYFKGKNRYSSMTGTIVSFAIAVAIITFGVYFLKEGTDRIIYSLNSSEVYVADEGGDLSEAGFDVVFDIRRGDVTQFDDFDRYFSLQALIPGSYINLTRCTLEERGFNSTSSELKGNNWCFPKDIKVETHRYGGGGRFQLLVNPCVNETSRPDLIFSDQKPNKDNCYPIQQIEENINSRETFIFLEFYDHQINHSSIDNVFPVFQNYISLKLSTEIFLRYLLEYQIIDYNIDFGFVFEDISSYRSYFYKSYSTQVDIVNKKNTGYPKYAHIDIVLDSYKKTYNRSYIKLQTVGANIGGAAKLFMLIGQTISFLYLNNLYFLELCNNLFTYSSGETESATQFNSTNKSPCFQYYKSRINERTQSLLINPSTKGFAFSVLKSPILYEKKESIIINREVTEVLKTQLNTNNYFKDSVAPIIKVKSSASSDFAERRILSQSLIQMLFFTSKEFKKAKELAYNVLSYEKLIHCVIELCELKDYLISEMGLKYSGCNRLSIS